MSEDRILYKTRKNNHGSKNRNSCGSRFPRHDMDYFPGTHLGMGLRYQKKTTGRLYKEYHHRGYIRGSHVRGIISKYVGKPYTDLLDYYYKVTKHLRDTGKEGGWKNDLEWYFEDCTGRVWGDFIVDSEGLVQVPEGTRKSTKTCPLNRTQIRHNTRVRIPDFGRVTVPSLYETREWSTPTFEKPQCSQPKYIGEYWCVINKIPLLLPVYHVPNGAGYSEYISKTADTIKPGHYGWYSCYNCGYPKKWNSKEYTETYSDTFRPGDYGHKWAKSIEETWVVPIIPFGRRHSCGLRTLMWSRMQHVKLTPIPNDKAIIDLKDRIERIEADIKRCEENNDTRWLQSSRMELSNSIIKLRHTPKVVQCNVGYGQLYPMVRRCDYERALRIYEQKQEETRMEG